MFKQILYRYIESGIPVIAGTTDHAVVIMGHSDTYKLNIHNDEKSNIVNTQGYLSSYYFINDFISNNDNLAPYQIVPKKRAVNEDISIDNIKSFIVPLYEKIYLTGEFAEHLSWNIINNPKYGLNKYLKSSKIKSLVKPYVLRTFLTSSKSFKRMHKEKPQLVDLSNIYRTIQLPKFIWITEISTEETFQNKKIIGEIVLDATAGRYEDGPFITIHYPGMLLYNPRHERLIEYNNNFREFKLEKNKNITYNMYIHNLGEEENHAAV